MTISYFVMFRRTVLVISRALRHASRQAYMGQTAVLSIVKATDSPLRRGGIVLG